MILTFHHISLFRSQIWNSFDEYGKSDYELACHIGKFFFDECFLICLVVLMYVRLGLSALVPNHMN